MELKPILQVETSGDFGDGWNLPKLNDYVTKLYGPPVPENSKLLQPANSQPPQVEYWSISLTLRDAVLSDWLKSKTYVQFWKYLNDLSASSLTQKNGSIAIQTSAVLNDPRMHREKIGVELSAINRQNLNSAQLGVKQLIEKTGQNKDAGQVILKY